MPRRIDLKESDRVFLPARDPVAELPEDSSFGTKGEGLARLPAPWRPPTLLLNATYHQQWRDGEAARPDLGPADPVAELVTQSLLNEALEHFGVLTSGRLLVRSSGQEEDLDQRGRLRSVACDPNLSAFRSAILEVWQHADNVGEERPIGIVVQPLLRVFAKGHLSNERRIARARTSWLCEVESNQGAHGQQRRVRASGAPLLVLVATTERELMVRLWSVGAHFSDAVWRYHFEWVWTGNAVYLVQADRVLPVRGYVPAASWRDRGGKFEPSSLLVVKPISDLAATSQKIAVQHTYARLKLPTAALFAVSGDVIARASRDANAAQLLRNDLLEFTSGGAVGRTDVDGDAEFFLPRTPTVLDVDELFEFLLTVNATVPARLKQGQSWRVLLHRYIPSRASAWAYAVPGARQVRVDGIWGVPDGLDWGRHDTFEVDPNTGEVLRKTIRFKDIYLDVKADGSWAPKVAGEPWDWNESISPAQLATMARGTRALADHERQPVHLMWFVGVRPSSGHPDCIPWYHHTNPAGIDFTPAPAHQPVAVIRNRGDLQKLDEEAQTGTLRAGSYVEVLPDTDLVRDQEFVSTLAEVSKRYKLVVVIEGSPLSHSYYVLRRDGAGVVCRDIMPDAPGPTRHFSKLVRDLVPQLIESRGEHAVTLNVPPEYAFHLMKQKLIEEGFEVFGADGQEDTLAELADVWEVVSALAQQLGGTIESVEERAAAKRLSRGGFDAGVILLRTQALSMNDARAWTHIAKSVDELDTESQARLVELPPLAYRESLASSGQLPHVVSKRTIEIPLVPPVPIGGLGSYRLETEPGTESVTIRYRGSTAIVYLGEPALESTEDQLAFTFDED